MKTAEIIFEQIKTLPEPMAREVLDFVGFLREKQEREGSKDLMMAQQESMTSLWNNEVDDVWNDA